MNEVTQELQERVHRWKQIELLCGFNIINNSGLQYLESVLYRGTANGRGTVRGELQLFVYMSVGAMDVVNQLWTVACPCPADCP